MMLLPVSLLHGKEDYYYQSLPTKNYTVLTWIFVQEQNISSCASTKNPNALPR